MTQLKTTKTEKKERKPSTPAPPLIDFVHFKWGKYSRYVIGPDSKPRIPLPEGENYPVPIGKEIQAVVNSGFLEYTPLDLIEPNSNDTRLDIHRKYATEVTDEQSALHFVQENGFLGIGREYTRRKKSESVEDILTYAKIARMMLGKLDKIKEDKNSNKTNLVAAFNKALNPIAVLKIDLVPNDRSSTLLKILPISLISYIWLRIGEEITGNLTVQICQYSKCRKIFTPTKGFEKIQRTCEDPNHRTYLYREENPDWDKRSKKKRKKSK